MPTNVQAAFTLGQAIKTKLESGSTTQSIAAEIGMGNNALTTRLNMTMFSDLILSKIRLGELESLGMSCVGLLANYGTPSIVSICEVINLYGNEKTKNSFSRSVVQGLGPEERLRLFQNVMFAHLMSKKQFIPNQYLWLSLEVERLHGLIVEDDSFKSEQDDLPPDVARHQAPDTPPVEPKSEERTRPARTPRPKQAEQPRPSEHIYRPAPPPPRPQISRAELRRMSTVRPVGESATKPKTQLGQEQLVEFAKLRELFRAGLNANAWHPKTLRVTLMTINDPEEYLRTLREKRFKYQREGQPRPDHYPDPEIVQKYVDSL